MTAVDRMSNAAADAGPPSRNGGTLTLARGLRGLELVAASAVGTTIQEVATAPGVHRTVAYCPVSTLGEFQLVTRGTDGRLLPGADLAPELESTASLLVAEGDEAIVCTARRVRQLLRRGRARRLRCRSGRGPAGST